MMPNRPAVLATLEDLAAWRDDVPTSPLVLVPTMGALHDGHRRLIAAAREAGGTVLVSIFVNPLQFGPEEDFDRYPRTLDADLDLSAKLGVDAVFAPSVGQMYPDGFGVTVDAGRMGAVFEGATRPGHFDGVLTVVLKLFNLIGPEQAFFGLKDIQQYAMVHRMVADLNLGIWIRGVPIVRDADGLALSSRNSYLDQSERAAALALSQALHAGAEQSAADQSRAAAITSVADAALARAGQDHAEFRLDYLELVDFDTFMPVPPDAQLPGRSVLAVAAYIGNTRLIDNMLLGAGWDRPM